MLSRSPWLQANQSAADMTARTVNGQLVLQKKRAKGTFTSSPETLGAHMAAAIVWPIFRKATGVIRKCFTSKLAKQPAASAWYKYQYANALGSTPVITPVLNLDNVIFGKGVMTQYAMDTPVADVSALTVTFGFIGIPPGGDPTAELTDRLSIVLINDDATEPIASALSYPNVAARSATAATLDVPTGWMAVGNTIRIYSQWYGDVSTPTAGTSSTTVLQTTVAVA